MPGEMVPPRTPDHGFPAAVTENHDKGINRRRSLGIAEVADSEFAPVSLGLGPGRGLDPPERATRESAVADPRELADRLVRTAAAVFVAKEFVEQRQSGRPLLSRDLGEGPPPVGHGFGQAELLDAQGLLSAIGGPVPGRSGSVTDRPLGDARDSRRPELRRASLPQDLDRHDLLTSEHGHNGASERVLDVRDQLESARCACRGILYDSRTGQLSGS